MSEQKAAPEIPEDLRRLYELGQQNRAWVRTADDVATEDGCRVGPHPNPCELIERIAALKAERDGLSAEIKRHEAEAMTLRREYDPLKAENQRLIEDVKTGNAILAADVVRQYQEQVARLSAPVSIREWQIFSRPFRGVYGALDRAGFNLLIASRTSPAQKEPE